MFINSTRYFLTILFAIFYQEAFSQHLPQMKVTYVSKKVFYAKYLHNKGSSEPIKTLPDSKGLLRFSFYKDYINIAKGGKSVNYKIVDRKDFRDDIRYYCEDKSHIHYEIAFWVFDDMVKKHEVLIDFEEFDKSGHVADDYHANCSPVNY